MKSFVKKKFPKEIFNTKWTGNDNYKLIIKLFI